MTATLRARTSGGPSALKAQQPLLSDGDRMTQVEFHRRYSASPAHVRAELINGVVHMGSPLHSPHGFIDGRITGLLMHYEARTPGVVMLHNTTTVLGPWSELQPDVVLRVVEECNGRSRIPGGSGPILGAPELVVEVSDSTLPVDLTVKKAEYRDAGVLEYLVFDVNGKRLLAFDLAGGEPRSEPPGLWRSRAFPGLWIDTAALFSGATAKALATLDKGLATKAHAKFVADLAARRGKAE